jgi:hypothetical protein
MVFVLPMVFLGTRTVCAEDRTFDGSGNNEINTSWGMAGTNLARKAPSEYADGFSAPAGAGRPSAREISNAAIAQSGLIPNTHAMTGWVFQWGQFVDHDLDLTDLAAPAEDFPIAIPSDDPIFDPLMPMQFRRSKFDTATGTTNPREQINEVTSYLDASMVYGSSLSRASALRAPGEDGKLLVSEGNLLPLNTLGLPNGTGGHPDPTQFYVAGDVRVNEQIGLTAIHTLFVREHNRLAEEIGTANPGWSGDEIYQQARKIVGAEIQSITYREFLPALLGSMAPGIDSDYDDEVNASILTEFSTVLFRVGHTMLPPRLMRVSEDWSEAPDGHMPLRDAFFKPNNLAGEGELEYMLKGLASEEQQEVDMHVIDDVRNFLFGEPLVGGFDLASLNIQRGRDHGIPDYNTLRMAFDLDPVGSFAEITSDVGLQTALATLYGNVNNVDGWAGAIAEDHAPGAAVGPLIAAGLVEQFTRIRDGDRLWYMNDPMFSEDDLAWLNSVSLSDIIRRNTTIDHLQANVFFMIPEPGTALLLAMGGLLAAPLASRVRRRRRFSRT